jgi:RimJ/RimL family protein N-acetyltransferase
MDALRIRPIQPEDKALLKWGLAHLSDATIQRRFLSPKPKFTAAELRYLTEVDGHDHVALVAVDGDGALVGVGRFVRLGDPSTAEIAIVIADPLQGQGLGTRLGYALVEEAVSHGIERFTATMQADNRPAHRLHAKLSARLESRNLELAALGGERDLLGPAA